MKAKISIMLDIRRAKKDALYPVKLRVYYNAKAVLHPTIYDLSKSDFEKLNAKRVNDSLTEIRHQLKATELNAIIAAKKITPFSFDKFYLTFIYRNNLFANKLKLAKVESANSKLDTDVPEEWKKSFGIFKEEHLGPDYISEIYLLIIKSLLYQARVGTAHSYQTSYNSLKRFRGNVPLSEITALFLKEYEGWMINEKGNSKTTVGINTRAIRAVINEAIERKLMSRDDYPFGRRRYRIPSGRNIKKALDKKTISKIYYSEAETESQQKARDFWFFSFYGNGMNVKDIIYLKYKNIQGEYLVFERAKTELTSRGGEPIIISCFMIQDMWDIIERWGNKEKDPENYIFPVLSPGLSPIRQYEIKQNFTQFINKNMAKISVNEELGKNIKTMETRHSVSTLMKNAGLSPHYIKESLGHASLKTTENYLAGFQNEQKKEYSKILEEFKTIEKPQ